jgi:hypothetical protein
VPTLALAAGRRSHGHRGRSRSAEVPATVGGWDKGVGVVSSHTWRGPGPDDRRIAADEHGKDPIAGTGTRAISGWRGRTLTSPVLNRSSFGLSPGRSRLETISTGRGAWAPRHDGTHLDIGVGRSSVTPGLDTSYSKGPARGGMVTPTTAAGVSGRSASSPRSHSSGHSPTISIRRQDRHHQHRSTADPFIIQERGHALELPWSVRHIRSHRRRSAGYRYCEAVELN